jgi:YHS domain-containing protein
MTTKTLFAALSIVALLPLSAPAQEAVKADAAKPVLCAVRGEELKDVAKAGGKTVYNNKTYYFCCANCKARFESSDDAGKAKFVKLTDLRTERVVLQRKMDAVNAQIEAVENPKKAEAVTTVRCAVTDEEIGTPDKAAGKTVYNGKAYYFCCAGCKPKFDADPAKYGAQADKKAAEHVTSK